MSESDDETSSSADWPVNEEWLQAVLKEHHKNLTDVSSIVVLDFTVRPGCDAGDNVLSDILAVTVKYTLENGFSSTQHILRVIIKLLPQDPFSRFFVTEAQFDLREIKFYTQIIPDFEDFMRRQLPEGEDIKRLPTPKCYYAHYSAGNNELSPAESVLVLEDLKTIGYVNVDFSRGLTLSQTMNAVETIAYIHALSLSFKIKEKKSLSERYPFLFQTSRASDSYQQLVERGLPQLFEFLERVSGLENILAALNNLRPHTKDVIEKLLSPKEPMALITHTDFWCNNLMFREVESNYTCMILDWQMVTYSRPTNDVALLLISSLPAELRRSHTEKFLDSYWKCFVSTCGSLGLDVENDLGYDKKQLVQDYRKSQLLALLLCIGSVDLALGNPQIEERLLMLLQDLHADGLLDADVANDLKSE